MNATSIRSDTLRRRLDAVRERVDIVDVIGAVVRLSRGRNPRGKCPFHGSKSDSLAVYGEAGRARCWGCGWSGDAIRFVQDHFALEFKDALARLESEHGLDGLSAAPVRRAKRPAPPSRRQRVEPVVLGRHLWSIGREDPDALRRYLIGRGVPAGVLTDARFADLRFVPMGPIEPWPQDRSPKAVPQAPAMVALMRRAADWSPAGVHVTFLSPDAAAKMARTRPDGSEYPARKMLGSSGGCGVLLGRYDAQAPLFVGEGIETVLSGMAIAGAGADAVGLAVLSLDNLQGFPRLIRGAIPLHDPQPDSERSAAVTLAHDGAVTGLIDADMKPLRGVRDGAEEWRGVALIERRRGPVVQRAMTTAERAELCGTLFMRAWRARGCTRVRAIRPRMGQDFNDAAREGGR